MKECPTCHRSYRDDSLNFCLEDGSVLSRRNDAEATLVLPTPAIQNQILAATQTRSNKLTYIVIAVLALLVGGGFVALLKSNSNQTARRESQPPPVQSEPTLSTPTPASRTSSPQINGVAPTGIWAGQSRTTDRGVTTIYSMSVNFDNKTADDGECRNQGRILSLGNDTISIDWPECGRETVRYSVVNATLSARGETIDIHGNVNRPQGIQRSWTLTRQ